MRSFSTAAATSAFKPVPTNNPTPTLPIGVSSLKSERRVRLVQPAAPAPPERREPLVQPAAPARPERREPLVRLAQRVPRAPPGPRAQPASRGKAPGAA